MRDVYMYIFAFCTARSHMFGYVLLKSSKQNLLFKGFFLFGLVPDSTISSFLFRKNSCIFDLIQSKKLSQYMIYIFIRLHIIIKSTDCPHFHKNKASRIKAIRSRLLFLEAFFPYARSSAPDMFMTLSFSRTRCNRGIRLCRMTRTKTETYTFLLIVC